MADVRSKMADTAQRWHIVVGGQPVGPLTAAELVEALASGEVDGDTLVWREGFDDWRRLAQVREIAHLRHTPAPAGLFDGWSATPPAAARSSVAFTGSRNEHSVLFSIGNLRDLAQQSGAPHAVGGSGLIDIRALAEDPAPDAAVPGVGQVIPLAQPGPVLAPASDGAPRWAIPAVVGLGTLLLLSLTALAALLLGPSSHPAQAAPSMQPAPQTVPQTVPASPASAPAAPGPKPDVAVPQPPPREGQASPVQRRGARPTHPRHRNRRPRRRTAPRPKPAVAPRPVAPQQDELSRLVDRALQGDDPSPAAASPRSEGARTRLPRAPSKRQLQAGLRSVRGQVRACYTRYRVPGRSLLRLTIRGDGRVGQVVVGGRFAGTPTGACLRQAFLSARFARFAAPSLSISYPVILN